MTLAFRCPNDRALLRKAKAEPFVEHLRELEKADWSHSAIDPKNQIGAFSAEAARMARRYLAIGMTFHPNPEITFGLLGAVLHLGDGKADGYLMQCSHDFGSQRFPLELARSLLQEYAMACVENTNVDLWTRIMGFTVARQFIRTKSGFAC